MTIQNSIFTGNSSASNGAVHVSVTPTEDHNLFFNNTGGAGISSFGTGDVTGGSADPNLLPLGYYGDVMKSGTPTETNGSTETMMPGVGSPAIGAGSSADVRIEMDQRGFPVSSSVDIGAVQTNYLLVTNKEGTVDELGADCNAAGTGELCSLPDAMAHADPAGGHDIDIGFSPTLGPSAEITVGSALNLTQGDTVIVGPPDAVTISGSHTLIFDSSAGLALYGLTLENGRASAAGAVYNNGGTLDVTSCTFAGNEVANNYSNFGGGAINNNGGALIVANSTFYNNGGSADYQGGAIYNQSGGTATVVNSTFSHNSAGSGGAIDNAGKLSFYNNIFSDSTATKGSGHGGAIYNDGGSISHDYNLFYGSDPGDGVGPGTHGVTGSDPKLLPLGHFGGPTETMMPGVGSAAIGKGTSTPSDVTLLTADQRGFPVTSAVDIGAIQTNYLVVTNTSGGTHSSPACNAAGTGSTCSLIDATGLSNARSYTDIGFSTSLGSGSPTITLSSTLPNLYHGNTVIVGPPDVVTISVGSEFFDISHDASATPVATLYGLTFTGGTLGAISSNPGPAVLTVDNCTFSSNASSGGAIAAFKGVLNVFNSTFSGNNAAVGGAIYSDDYVANIVNSTFYNNQATDQGGAIYNTGGALYVTSSTFSSNKTNGSGGAIYIDSGNLTVGDNIFSGNSATTGGGIDLAGGTRAEGYNLFFNNTGGNASGFPLSNADVTGDPKLASLDNYGGQTQTMLPTPGSAAICTARKWPALPGGLHLPSTDQRGFPRINTSYTGSTCVDMGAVQTDYTSIQFTNAPQGGYTAASTTADVSPAPIVSVTENGQNIGGVPVTLDVGGGSTTPTVGGNGPVDTVAGTGATFSNLTVSPGGSYTLSSTLDIMSGVSISTGDVSLDVTGGTETQTTVTAEPNPVPSGANVTLTAVVTAQSGGEPPTGTVTFTIGSFESTMPTGTCPAGTPGATSLSACATYTAGPLALTGSESTASYNAKADFTSNSGFAESTGTTTVTVDTVTDYVGTLNLNHGQIHSLTKEWDDAAKLAAKGQFNGAIGNLEEFIAEVSDLYSSGFLTEDQYNALIQAANYQIGLYQQGQT